jgi:hypothetical protein
MLQALQAALSMLCLSSGESPVLMTSAANSQMTSDIFRRGGVPMRGRVSSFLRPMSHSDFLWRWGRSNHDTDLDHLGKIPEDSDNDSIMSPRKEGSWRRSLVVARR